jgi:hypothetical protein
MRLRALSLCLLTMLPGALGAEGRGTLGVGRLFSNDFFGDGHDRWRTGSYALSIVRGEGWDGAPPDRPGPLLEWRLRTEIIAPVALSGPRAVDRPYATSLSLGLHAHWRALGGEAAAGADLVVAGPQTGLGEFMDRAHERLGAQDIGEEVLDGQVGNGIHPTLLASWARPMRLSPALTLRPFAELQWGAEDLARAGADVILGGAAQDALWLRDVPSGQLYQGIEGSTTGLSLVVGADWAAVGSSAWLPEDRGFAAEDERLRARAGVHWQVAPGTAFFYGAAWLSPEFVGQEEGQVTGQLKLDFNF